MDLIKFNAILICIVIADRTPNSVFIIVRNVYRAPN